MGYNPFVFGGAQAFLALLAGIDFVHQVVPARLLGQVADQLSGSCLTLGVMKGHGGDGSNA